MACRRARPPLVDGLITSIARLHDLTLVTDNLDDFRGFRGLKLVNWLEVDRKAREAKL